MDAERDRIEDDKEHNHQYIDTNKADRPMQT